MKFIRAKSGYWLIAVDDDFSGMDRHDRNVLHCAIKEIDQKLSDYERTTDNPILIWQRPGYRDLLDESHELERLGVARDQ